MKSPSDSAEATKPIVPEKKEPERFMLRHGTPSPKPKPKPRRGHCRTAHVRISSADRKGIMGAAYKTKPILELKPFSGIMNLQSSFNKLNNEIEQASASKSQGTFVAGGHEHGISVIDFANGGH